MSDKYTPRGFEKYIELTNLKSPKSKDIEKIVKEANEKGYYGVCLQANNLGIANKYRNKDLKLITVAGFPPISSFDIFNRVNNPRLPLLLGVNQSKDIDYIKGIVDTGLADEIDIILPMLWFSQGNMKRIFHFFTGVRKLYKGKIKLICELGTVITQTIRMYEMAALVNDCGLDYLKTNSGLLPQDFNSLLANIQLLKITMEDMKCSNFKPVDIKASGGIRTQEQIEALISNGVKRIGSSSIKLTKEIENEKDK